MVVVVERMALADTTDLSFFLGEGKFEIMKVSYEQAVSLNDPSGAHSCSHRSEPCNFRETGLKGD